MSSNLNKLKKRFVSTMEEVSRMSNKSIHNITRDHYIRVCVDNEINGRLNKTELNLIGGFKDSKILYFNKNSGPKILLFDIETTPLVSYTWGIWDQTIGLNQVIEQTTVLSWAAKWMGDDKIMYEDVANQKNVRNDKQVLKSIWKLLDEADIVVGHNSNSFDVKVLNARFIQHGMKPPSSYKKMDTKILAKRHFRFLSNKLVYLTDSLCTKFKKSSHAKFPGFSMWEQCLKGNKEAFKEMKEYNIMDVTSLEELFTKLLPWENSDIFNTYKNNNTCTCGSDKFKKSGFIHTRTGKFQRFKCVKCGSESRGKHNLNKYRK